MKPRNSSSRFSFLFPDLLAFNIIHFVLISKMGFMLGSHAQFYLSFVVFNNISWLICSKIAGIYEYDKIYKVREMLKHSFVAYLFFSLITWLFFDLNFLSGILTFVLFDVVWFGVFLLISRMAMLAVVKFVDRLGIFKKNIVIIGHNSNSLPLVKELEKRGIFYEIKGYFDDTPGSLENAYPLLGNLNDCVAYAKASNVSEIYSVISPQEKAELYDIAEAAGKNFIRFKFVPNFNNNSKFKCHFEFEENIPVMSLRAEPLAEISGQLQKRMFDIVFSSLVVIFILSWLVPILAVLIKLDSEGPVFFKQYRTGKNNQPFLCLKFRSLKVNNDADTQQVTKDDSRYTRLGRFLRRTNIDELPQFFNVLAGDMSVVGSRPHMLKHTDDYSLLHDNYMIRHSIKPGLTGWAQVNGYRGEIKASEQLVKRVEHDLWYIENWNFWLDMRIVLQTMSVTLKGDKNAY